MEASDIMKSNVMPFAIGMRNCVGQSLAMTELESVLPSILSRIQLQLIEENVPDYFWILKIANVRLKAINTI
jgi:cytochrome P450